MKKTLRGTIGAVVATVGLLAAAALPAGATTFKIDSIMKNDLNLKAVPMNTLTMGGSSFDGPLVQAALTQWQTANGKSVFPSGYVTSKSGTGRAGAITGALTIGFSDFPMNQGGDCDLGGSPVQPAGSTCTTYTSATDTLANFVQVPVVLGGVAIIFHFGDLSGTAATAIHKYGLTFTGSTLGQIFAGKITNWDSTVIAAANPHLKGLLPNLAIAVESRTSGSGTTFGFKDYLNRVDATDFPAANSAAFTSAVATYSNSGLLASAVASTPGAIGYVEYGYAVQNSLLTANLVNASKKTVSMSEAGILAAATAGLKAITASSNKVCKPLGGFSTANINCFSIENQVGPTVYPISLFSYAMVPAVQTDQKTAIAVVKFLDFLSHQGGGNGSKTSNTFGQDLADEYGYVPLPTSMQALARTLIEKIKYNGKTVLSATN